MPQYGVVLFAPAPADPMELTPEYLALLDAYPGQVEELGGRIVTGFALAPSSTAKAVRAGSITDGPFTEAKEVVAGFYVLEAPDEATAVKIAQLNPAVRAGGVEIRPLFVPPSA